MAIRRILQERRGTAASFGVIVLVAAIALGAEARRSPAPPRAAVQPQAQTRAPERSIALLPAPQTERLEFHDAGNALEPLAKPRPKRVRKPKPPVVVPEQGTNDTQPVLIEEAPASSELAVAGRHADLAGAREHQHESPVVATTAVADTYVPGSVGNAKRRWAGFDSVTAEPNDGPVTGFVTSSRKHCPPRGRHWMPAVHFHD